MPFLGSQPAESALTTGSLGDDIVTEAKMANDAIGLPELKAGTDGELITWDASGNPTTVAAGTAGHFLKSQGAGSVPVFAASGGIWDLFASGSYTGATAASIEFTSLTHDLYILYLWNMSFSDDQPLMITYSYNNGTHYANDTAGLASNDTKRYWYSTINAQKTDGSNDVESRVGIQTGEVDITAFSGAGSSGVNDMVPASAANLMGTIIIDRKADGENTLSKQGFADFLYHPAGYAPIRCNSAFMHTPSGTLGDMDAFKIFPDAGATIAGAHWKLYGTSV
tara:strand:+ start:182 stop:1024 length:843 start_codon:yes stop_codon:yes gene_type:complete